MIIGKEPKTIDSRNAHEHRLPFPPFPHHYHQFCQNLKQMGANVLGIGDAAYDALDPAVRDALTEYYRLADMHDYDQLVRACGYYTHRYGKIDRFESLNEYWLATEARIRDDFNISGVRGDVTST
jgi:hypothetical protein